MSNQNPQYNMKFIFSLFFLSSIVLSQAQQVDPLLKKDTYGQEVWVDSIVKTMSIEEKIGQLFMIQAYSNRDDEHRREIAKMIKEYHVGGLIFMQGTPDKQIVLNNYYQSIAKTPLIIGFDGEWGLDMRLKNTYRYPWNMALGAIQDDALIEEFGRKLGEECKRVGIHINFAPVADININPKNPIIGNRSFGEDRANVTRKTVAFTKGIQSVDVLACGKHFPGHGDTDADSHKTLPTIPFSIERLDSIELYPYKELFKNGLGSVMTAHLSVPSYEPNTSLPSSLSPSIVTGLLKEQMGFEGLIITDGLNMKGAANFSSSAEINLAAVLAGNDMLLIPQDVPETMAYMKAAVENGTLTEERLDESVMKILKAKYWVGLKKYEPIDTVNLHDDLNGIPAQLLHRKLVDQSITLLKNNQKALPITDLMEAKIAYVKLGDSDNETFVSRLKDYADIAVIEGKTIDVVLDKLAPYNTVVIGYHKSNETAWKGFKFTTEELVWLQEISRKKKVILTVFASPYSLLDIKSFTNIDGLVVAYQNSTLAQDLTAQKLFGASSMKGRVPVSIGDAFAVGSGLNSANLYRLSYGLPEEVGMSSTKLAKVDSMANVVIDKRMAPGAQILVARKGKVIYRKSFGFHTAKGITKVENNHLFDIASVTKILGGLPLIMKAQEEGKFTIETTLGELFPVMKSSDKENITLKEALSHYARLQAWIPYYLATIDSLTHKPSKKYYQFKRSPKFDVKVARNLYLRTDFKDSMIAQIPETPLYPSKRYKYSGMIFYLFKDYLEKTYQTPMDQLATENFYKPLGATTLMYNPLDKFSPKVIVPTEIDTYYRNQLLHGYVHDQGAAMFGGVNGNAGLFSDSNDIAKMMQMYLQEGYYGGKRYLKPTTINTFNHRYYADQDVRRGLGFDKPQINAKEKATCGCVSSKSFGHSGYTGTFTWADPESELVYVFLSNRVYPNAANNKLVRENSRTIIQQFIQEAVVGE